MLEANEDIEPVAPNYVTDQTMEQTITLGKLARGIAHDINNLVTSIQGNAQLAERALTNQNELKKSLSNIKLASRLITELTGQIQTFSRTHQMPIAVFNLTKVVNEIILLIRSTLPPSIQLTSAVSHERIYVNGASSQLAQAVMNLCTNALQALGRKERGQLNIELEIQNDQARIIVEDDGHGISSDKLDRIFDPFYTTKHFGMGSGLGLAVVKSVIDSHQGDIQVTSTPDHGTRFEILIPIAPEGSVEEVTPMIERLASASMTRSQTVLLVDDEPTIRSLGVDILHSLGYRVTVARDGREALEIFQRRPEYFDIILSDSRMPEMTGLELAAEIRKLRPEMPFILITAFDDTKENPLFNQLSITDIVPKPFRIEQLQRSLRQAMLGVES
ncbi:hybrid sensor histidine kinase/response regulator [Cerasicoccus arenae]|nr:ATP-binding protein [Cerasicoccus arenae]MBK1858278.1 response regulator [Cerasicoccus arenae]